MNPAEPLLRKVPASEYASVADVISLTPGVPVVLISNDSIEPGIVKGGEGSVIVVI